MKIPKSTFQSVPEGVYESVCVDVVDLGIVDGKFGAKHKLKIVWEVSEKMKDGRPYIMSQRYTASLNSKANLYKDLKSWRGRDFTVDELKDFEMDSIIGAGCILVVKHTENDGNVYANVASILKSKEKLAATGKYIRAKDRPEYVAPASNAGVQEDGGSAHEQDDIPF